MPIDRAALDLAVRDYVRDTVGKFATDAGKGPTKATIGPAGKDAKPGIDRERVNPAGVKSLADIRRIMREWRRVPFAQRAALKARLITKAKGMGADPRLLLLLSGLGDADGKREATEGSSRAIRRGNAREWLAKQRGLDMSDPVTALAVDLLDLSPGDYSPPYDWKHGFIPLTPAAVASKAGKGPDAGKGGKRAKAPRKSAAATPKPRKVAAGKPAKAAAPKSAKAAAPKPDTSQLATDQRADDARRGGGFPVPPELRNAKTKNGTPFPTVTPMAKASPLNDDPGTSLNGKSAASMTNAERVRAAETMFGTDSPQAKKARSMQREREATDRQVAREKAGDEPAQGPRGDRNMPVGVGRSKGEKPGTLAERQAARQAKVDAGTLSAATAKKQRDADMAEMNARYLESRREKATQDERDRPAREAADRESKAKRDPFDLPGINVLGDGVVTGDDERLKTLVDGGFVRPDPSAKPRPYRITDKGRALYKPSDADRQQSQQVEEARDRKTGDQQFSGMGKMSPNGKVTIDRGVVRYREDGDGWRAFRPGNQDAPVTDPAVVRALRAEKVRTLRAEQARRR